jgi:hypothetical protein
VTLTMPRSARSKETVAEPKPTAAEVAEETRRR